MVVVLVVDRVLTRADISLLINQDVVWPWDSHIVHLLKRTLCTVCGNMLHFLPVEYDHLVVDFGSIEHLNSLLNNDYLWCTVCGRSVFDHFQPDLCIYCDVHRVS